MLYQNRWVVRNGKESEGKKYTPKVFSALKTQAAQQAKQGFGVYRKACFQRKRRKNAYTPKSLQGVCGGPLRAVLVYRFWPPKRIGRSEKALRIRRFMSKFLGVSLLSSASKKARTWEHAAGTPCKLLSSRSFSERLERSEKAFRKKAFHLEVP